MRGRVSQLGLLSLDLRSLDERRTGRPDVGATPLTDATADPTRARPDGPGLRPYAPGMCARVPRGQSIETTNASRKTDLLSTDRTKSRSIPGWDARVKSNEKLVRLRRLPRRPRRPRTAPRRR